MGEIAYYQVDTEGATTGGTAQGGAPTDAGYYYASVTLTSGSTDYTAVKAFTISQKALTITGATATNRAYVKDNKDVTISGVTFKDSSENAVALTSSDYDATGTIANDTAGDGKNVNVTVSLTNGNYSLATNTTTTTVNISKAAAQTIANVPVSLPYIQTSVTASVAGKMPTDAGTLTYTPGSASTTGSVTVSEWSVNGNTGAVTATLSGGAAGDTVTLPVTIDSTNYADSTGKVVVTLTAKADADVTITGAPTEAKTYGDSDFTLTGSVTNAGTGTGVWTWTSTDNTVLQLTPNGATASVKILKAGSVTITTKYESDTTIDTETTATITVNPKELTIKAKDQSIYVGGTVPTLGADSYTVTGLVGEDTLTTQPTLDYNEAPDNTKIGTYTITPSGAEASANYSISYQTGTLTISSRPSSGGGTPATTTATIPVSGDEESVNVTVQVKGDTATVTGANVDSVLEAEDVGTVTIDVSALNDNVSEVVVPAALLEKIADAVADESSNADGLEIKLPGGSVSFDAEALAAIAEQADGKDLRLNLDDIGESKLNTAQKAATGDMAVQAVYDAYMTSNNTRISDFKGGKATVSVSYTLKDGQLARGVTVYYIADDGTVTRMPTSYADGMVSWTVEHFSNYVVAYEDVCPQDDSCPISAFTDAEATEWYHDGVHWALENNVMSGMSNGLFAPNGDTSRAMVAVMLWRLEDSPAVNYAMSFADVPADAWYTEGVRWANSVGVIDGYSSSAFGPNDPVTREQLASMLYRYAQYKGIDVSVGEDTNILSYGDAFSVSEWAMPAMQWAVGAGIITGYDEGGERILAPQRTSNRAVVATMFQRFCD